MPSSQLQYLPLSPTFFSILVGMFILLVLFIQLGLLRYAYVNIPVAELADQQMMSGREITYFGVHYVVPVVVDWPGTVIAVNVGGALIPGLMSIYLLARNGLWGVGLAATV